MQGRQLALTAVFLVAEAVFASTAWSAQAGRVQFVNGDVKVTDAAGQVRAMQKGAPINEGDTVTSAQNASAQIKMLDGGFVAIRPDTRLKFDSFKFNEKQDEPENALFSLFKGGFRAITGLIGRIRHEDYKITTPVATIGIRGTDHETVVVLPNDPLVATGQAAPGTYNKVNVGETSLTTDAGSVNVLPNQMGYAGAPDQMPQLQPINANLFTVTPPPAPQAKTENGGGNSNNGGLGARDTSVVDTTAQTSGGGSNTATTDSTAAGGTTAALTSTTPPTVVVNTTQVLTSTGLPALAAGAIGFFYTDQAGTWTTGGGGTAQTTASASGGLTDFTTNSTFNNCIANCIYTINFTGGSIGTASLLDQGANILAGNLHWGRWFGTGATVTGLPVGVTMLNSNLTYIGGDVPTMPVSGVATYVPVGGTSPVDAAGNTGRFLGATVAVSFSTSQIAVANMQVAFGSDTFTMSGGGSFLSNGIIPAVPMGGSCTGTCANGGVMTGDFAGAFTGANAVGLALAYHISSAGQQTGMPPAFEIMGAQGFIKQ